MLREFKIDDFTLAWGTIIKEGKWDVSNLPDVGINHREPYASFEEFKDLTKHICEMARVYVEDPALEPVIIDSWMSQFQSNSTMDIHTDEDHGGCISCVFWINGEEGQGGDLLLWDPRWGNPKGFGGKKGDGKKIIKFQPGKIVMFPSNVWHGVTKYTGNDLRLSINCTIGFKNVNTVAYNQLVTEGFIELAKKIGIEYDTTDETLYKMLQKLNSML